MNPYLENFLENNTSIEYEFSEGKHLIRKPWNDRSVLLNIEDDNDLLKLLDNIYLPEELVAIQHDDAKLEFIYGPLGTDSPERGRQFEFNYLGQSFNCHFSEVSDVLKLLANSFIEGELESKSHHRNLRFLSEFLEDDEFFHEFYEDPLAISFFVEGDFSKIENDLIRLSKHINFYIKYFDRDSAQIRILRKKDPEDLEIKEEKTFIDKFPSKISSQKIDETLLDIFEVAEETFSPRLKFIFYFQIIEYCSYYYMDEDLKNSMFKILRNPSISNDPVYFSKLIVEEFKDRFSQRDDSTKISKTINNYCSIDDIKTELKKYHNFFSQNIEFDGGLKIGKIISDEDSIDKLVDSDVEKIKTNIEKIRNVLVHLRESRENKVILPTQNNDHMIKPYLAIIRRMAENIAIQFD